LIRRPDQVIIAPDGRPLGECRIDYYITEWSARNPRAGGRTSNLGNANGLEYAQSTVEAFFELASNGIDGANFWLE
jgi:hypothetical protein